MCSNHVFTFLQLCTLSAERDEQHTQLVRERALRKQLELQLLKGAGANTTSDRHHLHPNAPAPSLHPLQRCLSHGSLHPTPSPTAAASSSSGGLEAEGRRDPGGAQLRRSRSAQRLEDPWVLLTGKPARADLSQPAETRPDQRRTATRLHI